MARSIPGLVTPSEACSLGLGVFALEMKTFLVIKEPTKYVSPVSPKPILSLTMPSICWRLSWVRIIPWRLPFSFFKGVAKVTAGLPVMGET